MAKKNNVYNQLQYDKLRKEIDTIINFIETLDVENIEDDIDWGVSSSGKVIPTVISTIERKIKITISTISECGNILLLINEKEGLTPYLESRIFLVKNCLESVQSYYERRPVDSIIDRIVEYTSGRRKDGSPIELKFIVASRFSQIQERMSLNRKVLEILPLINKLENLIADVSLKGNKEIPESMLYD